MTQLLKLLNQRATLLKQAIRYAESETTFPQGRLRISNDRGCPRYYHVTGDTTHEGDYISKGNLELAKGLAQKDYNKAFLDSARKELKRIEKMIKDFSKESADTAYTKLNKHRRNLIEPYIYTDDKYAEEWLKKDYKTNPFKPEEKTRDTNRGDKVRSKSEGFIANILFELGIPYHYEQSLKHRSGKTYYPDFTLLKKSTREVFYLEHLGLLDDETYRKSNIAKIDEYRAGGIYLGKNLLITYETEDSPLDIRGIKRMLKEIFEV